MIGELVAQLGEWIVRGLMILTGYVTNSSTFPQPLSEDEEAKCLKRLMEGDAEARSVLIERNLRLVAHIWPPCGEWSRTAAHRGSMASRQNNCVTT